MCWHQQAWSGLLMMKTQLLITCRWICHLICTSAACLSNTLTNSWDKEKKTHILTTLFPLQIEVCLPNGQCAKGTLQYCNLQLNIAVVNNIVFADIRAANLYDPMEIETASVVVAVGRLFSSGWLTTTRGIVADRKSNLDRDKLMVSTCKITKVYYSIPLIVTSWI